MSKKEQKLKKNLYKALTEYFIHNAKNNLSSSENILDQLASFRMETGLPAALRQDKKYQKAQKNCNKANEKMQDLNLTPQQWDTIDAAITRTGVLPVHFRHGQVHLCAAGAGRFEPRRAHSAGGGAIHPCGGKEQPRL